MLNSISSTLEKSLELGQEGFISRQQPILVVPNTVPKDEVPTDTSLSLVFPTLPVPLDFLHLRTTILFKTWEQYKMY